MIILFFLHIEKSGFIEYCPFFTSIISQFKKKTKGYIYDSLQFFVVDQK